MTAQSHTHQCNHTALQCHHMIAPLICVQILYIVLCQMVACGKSSHCALPRQSRAKKRQQAASPPLTLMSQPLTLPVPLHRIPSVPRISRIRIPHLGCSITYGPDRWVRHCDTPPCPRGREPRPPPSLLHSLRLSTLHPSSRPRTPRRHLLLLSTYIRLLNLPQPRHFPFQPLRRVHLRTPAPSTAASAAVPSTAYFVSALQLLGHRRVPPSNGRRLAFAKFPYGPRGSG